MKYEILQALINARLPQFSHREEVIVNEVEKENRVMKERIAELHFRLKKLEDKDG